MRRVTRVLLALVIGSLFNASGVIADDDDAKSLEPAEGTVTWRLTYSAPKADDDAEPKRVEKSVTVPIDVVDRHGQIELQFDDLRCLFLYSVDMAKIFVYASEGDKLLYERLFDGQPKNILGRGFSGENTVFHPSSGSTLKFYAFAGPAEGAKKSEPPKLTDRARGELADFTEAEIAAAKEHADFKALTESKAILIGKVRVTETMVLESFPPIYEYELQVATVKVLGGTAPRGRSFTAMFSVSRGRKPTIEENTDYLIALSPRGNWLSLLRAADDTNVNAACIAFLLRNQEAADGLKLARTAPADHPLHKVLSEAAGIAIIGRDNDPARGIEFDNRTGLETTTYWIARNLKGDLKTGTATELSMSEEVSQRMPDARGTYLVTYRVDRGRTIVDDVRPVNEESLLIVANALSLELEALKKSIDDNRLPPPRPAKLDDGALEGFSPPSGPDPAAD